MGKSPDGTMKKPALLLFIFLLVSPARAQQSSINELKKEVQALSETLKAMQKDIQEIKALLGGRAQAVPPQKVLLDLGNNPARGAGTAKLTLVEFSDYQ
jgi:protein-disulfide isomerase